eukprot:5598406-Prymnesium_polylepis.1
MVGQSAPQQHVEQLADRLPLHEVGVRSAVSTVEADAAGVDGRAEEVERARRFRDAVFLVRRSPRVEAESMPRPLAVEPEPVQHARQHVEKRAIDPDVVLEHEHEVVPPRGGEAIEGIHMRHPRAHHARTRPGVPRSRLQPVRRPPLFGEYLARPQLLRHEPRRQPARGTWLTGARRGTRDSHALESVDLPHDPRRVVL